MKVFTKNIYLTSYIIIWALCLLVLEFFTRYFFPEINFQGTDNQLIVRYEREGRYGLKPNFSAKSFGVEIITNDFGYRKTNLNYDFRKPNWLLLGDSVLMGVGVEKDSTFAGRLSVEYKNWNVLNAGVIGFSSEDYIKQLDNALENYELKRVSLFFCLNDIYNKDPGINNNSPGQKLNHYLSPLLSFLRENSTFYLLLKNIIFDRSKKYFEFDSYLYRNEQSLINEAISNINILNNTLSKRGIPFEIYLIPYEYQLRLKEDNFLTYPQDILNHKMNNLKINVKDTFNFMSKFISGKSKDLFLYGDPMHFSNKGHRILFKYIYLNQ